MIPYGKQHIYSDDIKAVVNVLKSAWLTQGPKVQEFEKALASASGVKYAVTVSNGTAALHLAYLAADLGKGDEVITTPNTFAATTNMLLDVGAKPVFSDIRLDTNNINEKDIKRRITKRTKTIVPVHFAGHPCDMRVINNIAKKKKILVIADACHALGATYLGKPVGAWADMSVYSFHPVKSITTGEGGAVVTNSKTFYERLLHLRNHGIHKDAKGKNVMTELGYNYRMTDIQAALGISQLLKLKLFTQKRHQVVRWYKEALAGIKEIILPIELKDIYSAWHLYIIRVRNAFERDDLVSFLKERGVGVNFHYPAVYRHPYYSKHGYSSIALKNADIYHNTTITLPCFPGLSKKDVVYVARAIKDFFDGHKYGN